MKKIYKPEDLLVEINITPFTDVILVLLIIFMIAAPLISQKSLEIKIPVASSSHVVEETKPAMITITGEGVVYMNNQVVNSKELQSRLATLIKKQPDLNVIVAADQSCRFQEVVRVIDILKETGVESLNIATRVK